MNRVFVAFLVGSIVSSGLKAVGGDCIIQKNSHSRAYTPDGAAAEAPVRHGRRRPEEYSS
jgi:hypothetical protein